MRVFWAFFIFVAMGCGAQADESAPYSASSNPETAAIHPRCLPGKSATSKQVTHYYVPILDAYDHYTCDRMEGTCIYKKNGEQWLHNYGYQDQRLSEARCKNGYGHRSNCLNPCRTIAASTKHHRYGELIFIKSLVGKRCGSERDGTAMIHDGFVYVGDTGSPKYFNSKGRFDFFWGRCINRRNGVCLEGAVPISDSLSSSQYCIVWDPANPSRNADLRREFEQKVRLEAIAREDHGAAEDINLGK